MIKLQHGIIELATNLKQEKYFIMGGSILKKF